jgi:hypothetical protein
MAFGEAWQERVWAWLASRRARGAVGCAIVVLVVTFFGLFLWAAVRRMGYPFEVEWIESGILVSVLRIAHGQGLYVKPTLEFVPFLYAPVYLYVVAGVTKLAGGHGALAGYGAMRLVSTLGTLGSCAAIYALVRTETQRRMAALAAAGLYVACYSVVLGFFDIGRLDSLFVMLLLLALLAQRRGHPVVAALLWVVVFQTKQTVLPLAVVILAAEWQRPRRMVAALATFAVAAAGSVLWLNHATGGWYSFYLFDLVSGLPIVPRQVALFVPVSLVEPMAVAWALIVAAAVTTRVKLGGATAMFYGFVSVALIGGIWFVEAHRGASVNAMMPAYAWVAVLFGVAMARLLDEAETNAAPRLALAVLLAVAVQLVALIYNPGRYVPPQDAVARTQRFIGQVRALPGDVYVLNHSYDAVLAGKQPHAEGEALGAVLDANPKGLGTQLRGELDAAMAQHKYSAVVVDSLETQGTGWGFEREYPLEISTGLSGYRYLTSQAQWFLLPCDVDPPVMNGLRRPDSVESYEGCNVVTKIR